MYRKILYNYVFNQQFLIEYNLYNVKIYDITSKQKEKIYFDFTCEVEITNINVNPCVSNIALISYVDGTCRIFNLLNKDSKELILFEGINNYKILYSEFNRLNPNIIASINIESTIIVWDVRELSFIQVIESEEIIEELTWSKFSDKYLEITNKNEINLINIRENNKIEANYPYKKNTTFLFLNENILIIIETMLIKKYDVKTKKNIATVSFNERIDVNDNLIEYNYLIVIENNKNINIIDILSFSKIKNYELKISSKYFFFYVKYNSIQFYSLQYQTELDKIKFYNISIDKNLKNKNNNDAMTNIHNNFYIKYEKYISKFMCILNFKENENVDKCDYIEKYMNIEEIKIYFEKIKRVNIFIRKFAVNNIVNNISKRCGIRELNIINFNEISILSSVFRDKKIKNKKEGIMEKLDSIKDEDKIKKIYKDLIKLLIIDNTNNVLVSIYLLFLQKFESKLIGYLKLENIEKFEEEVKYYSTCFSKEEYKELFGLDKESEKDIVLKFLDKVSEFTSFSIKDKKFINFVNDIKYEYPNYNQPLEFDSKNNELKWHLLKRHIFATFKKIKTNEIKKEHQAFFDMVKRGIDNVINRGLLTNNEILKDKNKLASAIYLITNPCDIERNTPEFFTNLLLSKKNSKEELEKKFGIKIKNLKTPLMYKDIEYHDIEDLCLDNLDFKNFDSEIKYNFNYLMKNLVKNQDKIKLFLTKIMTKRTFVDAYKILFGNEEYKLLDRQYLDEFINKRLAFVPIRPNSVSAISDKITLNTLVTAKIRKYTNKNITSEFEKYINDILNTGGYVLIEEHELFHLIDCLPYYESFCTISINTPRKRFYNGKNEGGEYLELLLFDKIFSEINLKEVLFILNEKNYDKSLADFKEDFKKLSPKDLKINGVFSYFNDYVEKIKTKIVKLNDINISLKKKDIKITDFRIEICLDDDVVGRI